MKADLRQMCLLVAFLMLDSEGILRLTEGKTFRKFSDQPKDGTPPSVITHPKDKTVREGKGLSLFCAATGKPKPRIIWKKNGKKILSDTDYRIKIRNTDSGSKLRIRDTITQDSGIYHCVAKNHRGHNSSAKAIVEVREKTAIPLSGTCQPYEGSICSSFISIDAKVYIPHLKSQQMFEENIVLAASMLTGYINPTCKKSLLKALCYNLFPPCQSGKQVRPALLCKDECEVLQARTCSKEFRLLRERLGVLAKDTVPNCSILPYDGGPDTRDCLVIRNKTVSGRDTCQQDTDPPEVIVKPLKGSYITCSERLSKRVKIYNKEVFQLVKNVKSEIQNGGMALTSHSSELSTYCFSASVSLRNLVREWSHFHQTTHLPNLPGQWPHDLTVPGLKISTLNSSMNSIWIPLGSADKYKVHEKITLRNVTFFYRFKSGHGSFIAEGQYDLCETVFKLTVETLHGETIKLSGSSETPLDVSTIETPFVSARPGNTLLSAIEKTNLFVLRLMNPTLEAYINKDLIVKFSGKTYFGPSALPATLEFFGGKLHRNNVLLAGITSPYITINQALRMFTGLTIPYLDILKHSANGSSAGIIMSAYALDLSKTPYRRFQQQPLSLAFQDTVPAGLSLVTSASIPEERHNSSQVRQLFQTIFGRGSEFTLKASYNTRLTLDWHFHNLSKLAVASFDRMQMQINGTVPPFLQHTALPFKDISVDGIIYKNDQRSDGVPFSGQLKHEARKLQGSFGSQSVWRRAFGIEYLTMKNLRLGLSLPTDKLQKSRIRGEADLELGSFCNATRNGENHSIKKNCITGHLYLGFSERYVDHFFYGTLSPVSLQKLLEVCNINHKLPGAMATIGFPEGLQISVARGAHDLSSVGGPILKPGFILEGKMSVLGIETTGAISLLPREFLIDAKIISDEPPATLDDVTPLFMSSSDPHQIPKLFLKARMDPVPFVKVDGYARLFGIFKEVRMLVTSDSLEMYLTTEVNKSFKINVHMTTNYSSNRNETQFNATVVFDNGLSKLTRLASKQVVSMLESEMSKLKSAKGEVQRLRRECVKTIKRECSSCMMGHGVCASSLQSLDAANRLAKSSTNTSERKRDTKRTSSTMDICQQIVMERCLANKTAYHDVCRFVSAKLNKTCAAYEAAARSQRELERGLRWVRHAEQFMYSDLFQIHSLSFKTNVTSGNLEQLYLDTVLEVTIFGQKQRLDGLRMDFNEFVKLSSEIAKYAVDWYQKTQPPSKSKSRHPDNRPRPPAS